MSTEIIEQEARPWFTEQEARRATELTRVAADRVVSSVATYVERVTEDYERRADVALGYESWEAYATSELAGEASFPTEIRRTIVGQLSQIDRWASREPMSTRAIAPVVGVSHQLVSHDRQVAKNLPPETPSQTDIRRESVSHLVSEGAQTHEIAEQLGVDRKTIQRDLKAIAAQPPKPEPAERVTGLDGKSYPARRPASTGDPSDGEPEVSIIEPDTGEIHTEPDPEHHYRTEGLHGYVPPEIPEPSKPHTERRKPWTDLADAAILQLDSAVKAIEALAKDDRFPKYKGDATKTARYIALDRDALSRVIDQFN